MKLLSRDNPLRPLLLVGMLYLSYFVIGYVFFFVARTLPTPDWGPDFMVWCAPVIKAIQTATQVGLLKGHDPFPIQVVILYSALGIHLLVLYSVIMGIPSHRAREKIISMMKDTRQQNTLRITFFFTSSFMLFLLSFLFYQIFFTGTSDSSIDSWYIIMMHSPTLFAASFFLLILSLMPLLISSGITDMRLTFSWLLKFTTQLTPGSRINNQGNKQ